MKNLFKSACVASLMLAAAPIHANQIFDFSFNSPDIHTSGQLFTSDLIGNTYTILGISGTIDGIEIGGIAPPGSLGVNPNFSPDNLLFATGSLLDIGGFIINPKNDPTSPTAHAPVQIQQSLFVASTNPNEFFYQGNFGGFPQQGSFTATLATPAVPLPATVWLFGSALLAGLGSMRKKSILGL